MFFSFGVQSQEKIKLLINSDDPISQSYHNQSFKTMSLAKKEVKNLFLDLITNGYLTAQIDSTLAYQNTLQVYLSSGREYKWAKLRRGNVPEELLEQINFREKLYSNKPFNPAQIQELYIRSLQYFENNGYPFAEIGLDSIILNDNIIEGSLFLNPKNYIAFDTVAIKGDANISQSFIAKFLNIKKGQPYNEQLIRTIDQKLKKLPFLELIRSTEVFFTKEKAIPIVYINKKNAGNFNGIIGFQPQENTGKIEVTGDLDLNLKNALGKGEHLIFKWRKLRSLTQELNIGFKYPYIFKTQIGTDFDFGLFKQDTSYLEVDQNYGLKFLYSGTNYIKVFYNNHSSNLISTTALENSNSVPEFADVTSQLFGIGLNVNTLDYYLNPRKGFSLEIDGGAGVKEIRKNPKLDDGRYDSLNLNASQYKIKGEFDFFIPLFKQATIKLGANYGTLYSDNIFQNEMFRIGGLKTIRGFDESSIFASSYVISTIELRFLFEKNSNFFIFGDGAWYENRGNTTYISDRPIGFGGGVNFETKAGIFSLTYALGKQMNNPIDFGTGKIHFGFVNFF